jgi:type II secretory pathway component PulF
LGVPAQRFFAVLAWAGRGAWLWGPVVPLVIIAVLTAWWLACTRTTAIGRGVHGFFGRVPWMGRMLRCSQTATFLEILALLVENQTPLPEAITLAAEASGDPAILRVGRQWAAALASGQTLPRGGEPAFPPLVHWLFMAAGRDGALLPALRHAAAAYHRRARYQSNLLRVFLPIFFTVAVAGGATALYALALFLPYVSMLYTLSR